MAFEDFWFSKTDEPTGASLRFSGAQSMSRTITVSGNTSNWSLYFWVKRANLGTDQYIFDQQGVSGFNYDGGIRFTPSDSINFYNTNNFAGPDFNTPGVYRDPGAWYHVGMTFSGGATLNGYVNGILVATSTVAGPDIINSNRFPMVFGYAPLYGNYLNGYLSDAFFVSGQTLLPTTFGQFDANGVWVPLDFTTAKANVITAGGFGTNGFALRFESQYFNSGTLVWADQSGNGNNFTANWNCQTGAGAGTDVVSDGPPTNYLTWNPLQNAFNGNTLSFGNLRATSPVGSPYGPCTGTVGVSTGKWYWETTFSFGTGTVDVSAGIIQNTVTDNYLPNQPTGYAYMAGTGNKGNNGLYTPYGAALSWGDTVGVALDMDAGSIAFYKNGVSQGVAFTGLIGTYYPAFGDYNGIGGGYRGDVNFGQLPFLYTPPTGFNALEATNLAAATIPNGSTGFQAILDTGANILSTAQATFPNGLWWVKDRVNANNNQVLDSVRGGTLTLNTNNANANGAYTAPSGNSVAWCWSTDASGLNTATGFQILTYTGTGVSRTLPHGLGVAPNMMIVKSTSFSTWRWSVYHTSIGAGNELLLDSNNASAAAPNVWNNTSPTSSVFSVGTAQSTNYNLDSYVVYLWAPIAGYSSFGSYTGNGSADGPFVYTGMKPAWVLIKCSSTTGNWEIYDNARNTYNPETLALQPNLTNAESTINGVDFLSNGFKVRTTDANFNTSGQTYIYAAFAENPFGGSNVAPVTAR